MNRPIRPAVAAAVLTITTLLAACGSQGGSPTAPSTGSPAAGNSSTSVVISGTLRSGSAFLSEGTGGSMAGMTVTVVGTSITAAVDGANHFTLTGVPAGDVQLRFSGGGVESTITLTQLQAAQTVTVIINVSGSTVAVETEQRSGAGSQDLEGRVESLPPTTAAGALKVAGRTVLTTGSTTFVQGGTPRAFGDLKIGMRVRVKGSPAGADLAASEIRIQNTNTWLPVNVNGVVDSLLTGATFQFKIGSRLIKGDDLTAWFGTGNTSGSIAMLADGVRVEVKGQQRDGYIYAERIHVNEKGDDSGNDDGKDDDDDDGDQDSSASIRGILTVIGGAKPALTMTVGGASVRTTGETTVKRRGDTQTLDQLKVGQSLHVVGTRQPDGSLVARHITIDDDAAGGEFEIEGSAGGVKGTCPVLSFSVNGFDVTTSAATTFEGGTCASLKSGSKVTVKGTTQAGGPVLATRVRLK